MHVTSLLFHDVYRERPSESGFSGAVADRYKLALTAFDAVIAALRRDPSRVPVLAPVPAAPPGAMALTVDDGGTSYASIVADRLERAGWRGHCFMSTAMIGRPGFLSRQALRDLDRRGHVIGSHSATHPTRFSACSWLEMVEEWRVSRSVLEDLLGHEVTVASLPGGYFSRTVARSACEAGVRWLFTSEPTTRVRRIDGCDVAGRYTLRAGQPADLARALADRQPFACWREWSAWNAKKFVKPVLGPMYPRLGALIHPQPIAKSASNDGGLE